MIADLHLGDERACASRPFANAKEMDCVIFQRWNLAVRSHDIVYVLGDIGRRGRIGCLSDLRGEKHLVAGNCDDLRAIARTDIFASVSICRKLKGFLLTHIPVHPNQIGRSLINVHGHLHAMRVGETGYCCVSVEQTNYTPVTLESLAITR